LDIAKMNATLTRDQFLQAPRACLHKGRFFNATLWRVTLDGEWVVKDFSRSPAFYRWIVAPLVVRHEYRIARRLKGLKGVPQAPFLIDGCAWGYRWIDGEILHLLDGTRCSEPFFVKLEQVAKRIHVRDIVHLDLRNARNVLVDAQGDPHVIDFQSALFTRWLPGWGRRYLERVDLSGVYKHWLIRDGTTLGAAREALLYWQLRRRYWWPFRGYCPPGRRALYRAEIEFLLRYRQKGARGGRSAGGTDVPPERPS
jgi:hypothetical protein